MSQINFFNDENEKSYLENLEFNFSEDSENEVNEKTLTTNMPSSKKQEKYFNIYKIPKLTKKTKINTENLKALLNQKTNRNNEELEKIINEKNYFLIDNKIYTIKDNLSKEEKKEIQKIQNRISAQKSRDEKKNLIIGLKSTNLSLKEELEKKNNELKEKEAYIKSLEIIINSCTNCKEKLTASSLSIEQNDFTNDSSHCSNLFGFGSIFTVLLLCLLCLIAYPCSKRFCVTRNLKEKEFDEDKSPKPKTAFLNKISFDYEYEVKHCPNKKKLALSEFPYEELVNNYFTPRVGRELNYRSFFDSNTDKCFNFRMIVPCEMKNGFEPVITIEDGSNIIKTKEPYYEMHCKIYQVNLVSNE